MINRHFKNIHIIINPASGRPEPVLFNLNQVLQETDIEWDISITQKTGDATRLAKELVATKIDLLVVCGGDGTIMEVISGMIGSTVPLGILPGGTGNVLVTELGIPGNLKEALWLMLKGPFRLKAIDIGQLNDRYFTQRVSFGYETEMVQGAERELKNKFGRLAYFISAIKGMKKIKIVNYEIVVDKHEYKTKGLTCIIANSGNLGFFSRLTLDKNIDITDGLLDILVIKRVSIHLIRYFFRIVMCGEPSKDHELVAHWQGKDIKVTPHPNQRVQCDGELLAKSPVHVKVIPEAIQIVVPKGEGVE